MSIPSKSSNRKELQSFREIPNLYILFGAQKRKAISRGCLGARFRWKLLHRHNIYICIILLLLHPHMLYLCADGHKICGEFFEPIKVAGWCEICWVVKVQVGGKTQHSSFKKNPSEGENLTCKS